MYLISKVEVDGFWGTYSFDINMHRDVTFFIGQNGTGKTTFINLLAAALTGDFRTLDRISFKKIVINFIPLIQGEKPRISISKRPMKDKPFDAIYYKITPAGLNAKEENFSLDDTEEQFLIRRLRQDARYLERFHKAQSGLVPLLSTLVSVKWLSIHRVSPLDRPRDERPFESSVDQKLEALSNELVRYFSTLSKLKDDEIRAFQEYIFVSLVENNENDVKFKGIKVKDALKYGEELKKIFQELHVQRNVDDMMDNFIKMVENANARREQNILTIEDISSLVSLSRIEGVVKRWGELQDKLRIIFKMRDIFQEIADKMFQRKKMTINESNEIEFISRSGKKLSPQMLSSGEKQLFILMSEALLQKEMPAIFIADEPELSLHVLWQEKLVSSLRELNPNAQIIAATHSPDIVGALHEKVVDMETLIQ